MFTWTSVEVTKQYIPRERKRIAAVCIETDQIAHIFNTCGEAARAIIHADYFISPSPELVKECAAEIAKAASKYHKEVLGYYWKWI